MALSETIKKNGVWIAVILFILAGAVFVAMSRRGSFHAPNSAYFIDEETGEESIRPLSDIPPLVGKGGKETVVREVKYSTDGQKTVKVAYYFKFNPATKQRFEEAKAAGKGMGEMDGLPGELVRLPAPGSKWVSVGSDEGQNISHIDMGSGDDFVMVYP